MCSQDQNDIPRRTSTHPYPIINLSKTLYQRNLKSFLIFKTLRIYICVLNLFVIRNKHKTLRITGECYVLKVVSQLDLGIKLTGNRDEMVNIKSI